MEHPKPNSPTASAAAMTTATASAAANSQNPVLPSISEMIFEAIRSYKDPTGSSRQAIESFMKKRYNDALPNNFEEKVKNQLVKLRELGQLIMVKHSYKLASTRSASASGAMLPASSAGDVSIAAAADAVSSRRKVGRPSREPAQIVVPFATIEDGPAGTGAGSGSVQRKGAVAKPKSLAKRGPVADEVRSNGAESLFVALGLEDLEGGQDRRLDEVGSNGPKRRLGRHMGNGNGSPAAKEPAVTVTGPKRRGGGRPRKGLSGFSGVSPDKVEEPVPVAFEPEVPVAKKRRGRQPKSAERVVEKDITHTGGIPVATPEQSAHAEDVAEFLSPYDALKRKFKYLQDTVKATVNEVTPSVSNAAAVKKLNNLNELASVLSL